MQIKRIFSFAVSIAMLMSCVVTSPFSVAAAATDYGVQKQGSNGSIFLYFGQNSITTSGSGEIISSTVNSIELSRPDNLKTDDSNVAVLTLPSVDLNGKDFNKIELWAANKNGASVIVKVGDTEVASFDSVMTSAWDDYTAFTADLTTTAASGNVTLNITSPQGAKKYCGNYGYIKIYKDGVTDTPVAPSDNSGSTGDNTGDTEGLLPYQDESLSFEERAADLVSRMTLEEKVGQIGYQAPAIERLGVSKYDYWKEALHGVARQGKATSFPTALSMSNTWNRDIIQKMADATSTEARAKNSRYNLSYWSPTVNMARDPRWGRNEETFGEDPYLSAEIGSAFVKGMQGDDEKYLKVIATLKHFAANNNEANRSSGSSEVTEFNFRNYYTRVFQNITEKVMPASIMSSYNATSVTRNGEYIYNFIPSLSNSYLLQDLLRRNWGFDGYVTSDCGAGKYLLDNAAFKQALLGSSTLPQEQYIGKVFQSGLNVECSLSGGNMAQALGVAAVENGYIKEEELERVVYELFLTRFRTGEFDSQAPYRTYTAADIENAEHINIAEELAEETLVLLKNDNNTLPLKNTVQKVAVVGNMANTLALGDYTGKPEKTVNPIEGIKAEVAKLNANAEVKHLGVPEDNDVIFNVKSLTLVYKDGKTKAVDLSKATNVTGMTLENGEFKNVTPKASAVIPSVNFENVVSVKAEISTGSGIGGSFNIAYGNGGPTVAAINSTTTTEGVYAECSAEYTGADGGYNGTVDAYISASPTAGFSLDTYKAQLDEADVIIAYAGTVPKQDGFGTADSSESKDRSSINLPTSQSHVQEICDNYADKTVVVMSTVGQINVEPFMDKCKAILWTSYNGQTQGTALGKVLTGEVNPSGRLTTTWYKNADVNKMELSNGTAETKGGITGKYTDYNIQPDGTNPGHTYQYYTGTPVYPFGYGLSYTNFEYSNMTIDKTNVDANGTVTVSVDVKNSGNVAGKEVVQLYVAHPQSTDSNMPKKQLKGFEKVELAAGETKNVSITLNVRDMYLFSEKDQKDFVLNGTYTAYLAKNANDEALSKTFEVTGTLDSKIKTVKAIPDGITVKGRICEDGSGLEASNEIKPNLSVVMTDEVVVDMSNITVTYTSSNTDVAKVDDKGVVTSGAKEGVAVITANVEYNGEKASTSFPVVNSLLIKPTESDINSTIASLTEAYNKLPTAAYSDTNWTQIEAIYNNAIEEIRKAETRADLDVILALNINKLNSVEMDKLEKVYKLNSENPKHIENGTIDYRDGGIPMYDGASGTITVSNPYQGIKMQVTDADGNAIDSSKIVWQIKKFDESVRKVADIDSQTGELTVYGNGIVQITAANVDELKCGTLMVQVNMQIEAEYADEANGANLMDNQSGSSGGLDAGSTGESWIEYKSVKLSNLDSIDVRVAGKNAGVVNVSLAKDTNPENLIATESISATGGWSTWTNKSLTLKTDALQAAQLAGKFDEYGCATIYVQTNGINLDYFRMNYIENNDAEPYIIEKTLNKTDGKIKATLKYRGTTLAKDVKMIYDIKDADGKLKNVGITTVKGTGEYEIATSAVDGDIVQLYIWDSMETMIPLSKVSTIIYNTPVDSEIVEYSLTKNSEFEKLTGGTDGVEYADTVEGVKGYGAWVLKNDSGSYTYVDVNEKEHTFSFTKAWQAGTGAKEKRSLYFTPKAPCKVTAVFNGSEAKRSMTIWQSDDNTATQPGTGSITGVSINVTDITKPVYIYGGSSNKNLYAIIVEYYGTNSANSSLAVTTDAEDEVIQAAKWNGSNVVLTKNKVSGETKILTVGLGNATTELNTNYFYESDVANYSDIDFKINKIAEYNGRLYAGCDNGLVIVFTECVKCYKLKKVCDFDIKSMTINGDTMYISDGTNDMTINMTDIGGESIEPDEASVLVANGGILVDVRSAEEFAAKSVEGSVNIPVDNITEGLAGYSKDTILIFYCEAGSRAAKAVKAAKAMGFTNVYNLESINKLI